MKFEATLDSNRNSIFRRKAIQPFCLAIVLLAAPVRAEDTELTNYKTGIDLHFGNSASTATDKGVAYAEEYFYFDKVLDDHKVVYIKAGTDITMSHNARNIAGDPGGSDSYVAAATNIGQIRYKVDGDHKFNVSPLSWTAYTAPFAFEDLDYGLYGDSGTKVVGTYGDNGVAQHSKTSLPAITGECWIQSATNGTRSPWRTTTVRSPAIPSSNPRTGKSGIS
jgi:hypothetical protein